MSYKIIPVDKYFVVCYFRETWRALKKQPKHTSYEAAYSWLVGTKFSGNYALAYMHVYLR